MDDGIVLRFANSDERTPAMDRISKAKRSSLMKSVSSGNTKPEILVRKLLHKLGFRFRLRRKDLPGKPDIVLPKYNTVIFVHGCFWHGHDCPKGKRPTTNEAFWNKKLGDNIVRDKKHNQHLEQLGWSVIVVWECELKQEKSVEERLLKIRDQHGQ